MTRTLQTPTRNLLSAILSTIRAQSTKRSTLKRPKLLTGREEISKIRDSKVKTNKSCFIFYFVCHKFTKSFSMWSCSQLNNTSCDVCFFFVVCRKYKNAIVFFFVFFVVFLLVLLLNAICCIYTKTWEFNLELDLKINQHAIVTKKLCFYFYFK
jgi:hypothetical protein